MKLLTDTHATLLGVLKGIEAAAPLASEDRRGVWDRCWKERSEPDYFSRVVRYRGGYFDAPGYERAEFNRLREEVFSEWFSGDGVICEYGCGTGHNLEILKDRGKKVIGFDWSESAIERCTERGIEAYAFNMLAPPVSVPGAAHGAAVLTVHAMEQLGEHWGAFFDYLLYMRPSVVVHIEPIVELYDKNDLLDYLALKYHAKRGYLTGYYEHLGRLDADNEIELLDVKRSEFGSLYHDAYSVVVWRPLS